MPKYEYLDEDTGMVIVPSSHVLHNEEAGEIGYTNEDGDLVTLPASRVIFNEESSEYLLPRYPVRGYRSGVSRAKSKKSSTRSATSRIRNPRMR